MLTAPRFIIMLRFGSLTVASSASEAEIAISTQKLHFRGPLGAEHLLTNKWYVLGDGQVRG